MTIKNRNLPLTRTPKVEAQLYDRKIKITTGTMKGDVLWTCTGHIEVWCAVELIKNLRKALREVRDYQVADLNDAVSQAEGPVT